jgi:hypothetical protein
MSSVSGRRDLDEPAALFCQVQETAACDLPRDLAHMCARHSQAVAEVGTETLLAPPGNLVERFFNQERTST